ncbi:MAG: LLM class F420-dependent oxidoreductase [Porticoccaceae bacterium]|nr:LLM class F420-dependent oxidoreductase [Porticoccaceae bacterium]
MKFGVQTLFGGPVASRPEFVVTTGKAIEERGFSHLWAAEHVVNFQNYTSSYPYSDDGVPPFGADTGIIEPFTALTFLAAHTTTLKLGTGISILPQRNPVYFAKQAADVDVLSNGRLVVGVGTGWSAEEFGALNVPFERRGSRTRDYLQVVRSLWCDEVSSFSGDFYQLPECVQSPKPVQRPHPPLFFGGESNPALRRVAEFGQGWMGYRLTPDNLSERLQKLEAMLSEYGRSLDDIEIAISPYDGVLDLDTVKRFADLGVAQIILVGFADSQDDMLRLLDAYADSVVIPGAEI